MIAKYKLSPDQKGLLIFDCWSKHLTDWWIDAVHNAQFEIVFVPANHTGNLQPMDLSVNFLFKSNLSTAFNNWLTKQILLQLQKKVALKDITINDSMMVLKV